MFSLPDFLSFSFSLPSLPSISLPTNIQRRFLSFVLKRALGRFIRSGLDEDKIQSQIGEGKVETEGLIVDEEEINSLIPHSIPLILTSGSVDKVYAQIPFPNLWSAPLALSLDTLTLDFTLTPPTQSNSQKGKSPENLFSKRSGARDHSSVDLSASVTTAAGEFLHDELDTYEEAELDRSIRQSLVLSRSDPFVQDNVPGAFPSSSNGQDDEPLPATVESTTVLAGLVERILARLEFKINTIRMRIRYLDNIIELRVGQIRYADESASQQDIGPSSTTRTVRISDVSVYMLNSDSSPSSTPVRSMTSFSRSSSTSSASSSSTDTSTESGGNMAMSFAVADLRQSTTSELEPSVYHSAISEGSMHTAIDDSPRDQSETSMMESEDDGEMIMSLGNEDIVLRMKTTQPANTGQAQSASSQTPGGRPSPHRAPSSFAGSTLPSIEFDISIGTITLLLLPQQMVTILIMSRCLSVPGDQLETPTVVVRRDISQPKMEGRVRVKAIVLSAIYDMASESSLSEANAGYWARPSSFYLPVGHLKVKLEGLESTYSTKGHTPRPQSSHPGRPLPRRSSTTSTIRFGPKPPVVTLRLSDLSIFEYIATDTTPADPDGGPSDSIPGGAYPVLLFDAGLAKQYDITPPGRQTYGPNVNTFPEFDLVDWRNSGLQKKSGGGEKGWKVRPKGKGAMKAAPGSEVDTFPVLVLRKELSESSPAVVESQPVHIFLDLSLVERLLPVLRHITPFLQHPKSDTTPHQSPQRSSHHLPSHFVIDDLDAQASSVSTLQATGHASDLLLLRCPMIRLDIRCPAPPNRRGSWGDGAHLRSGIVTLDLHGLHATVKRPGEGVVTRRLPGQATSEPKASVEWEKMLLFFCRVPDKKAAAFVVIGPLSPDPTDTDVLLPIIELRSTINPTSQIKISTMTCRIPSIQAKIRQRTIEGLQFFADDITHWLDGAFGDGSAPKPRDDLKMIGSRFFGSKGSSSASSSTEDDEDGDTTAATVLRLFVTEADIGLHVPRQMPAGHQPADTLVDRILSLRGSDIDVKLESNTTGRQETALTLVILDAEFADRTNPSAPSRILARTTPLSLAANNLPLLNLRFSSLTHPQSGLKETGIKVVVSSSTFFVNKDLSWAKDLAVFAKTPEGVFEDVVPSEVTRIGVSVVGCALHAKSPTLGGAIVVVVGVLEGKIDIESGAESRAVDLGLGNLAVLAVDDLGATTDLYPGQRTSLEAYQRAGYAPLADLVTLDMQVVQDLTGSGELLVDIMQTQLRVAACADSLATFGALVADIAAGFAGPKLSSPEPVRPPTSLEQSVNVFDSIEENAFRQLPDISSGADLIEDDLPTNLDYLDTATRPRHNPSTDRSTGESLRSWQATHDDGSADVGETVKVLLDHFELDEDYWDNLLPLGPGYGDDTRPGNLRVRVHDANISIQLHEGYDWVRTRKTIEEEIKAVRRRLAKIRQLLASGQKADESLEKGEAGSMLFNSVYIGLDQDQDGLEDPAALLAAIDDELEEGQSEMNTQSSWQTLPGGPAPAVGVEGERKKTTSTSRLNGKRSTRSKKAQIEINLTGIKAEYDLYQPQHDVASRVNTTIQSMEILDHIKTSTWKKFLTEMKSDARGNVRETDADMVRVELVAVRPSLPSTSEESRLKAKILPLRLHVDQDALDFLKRFFSFSIPPVTGDLTIPKKAPSTEPFFQHVEIYPIELKLDYKPKRVDFAALRDGKTMELMNFFHFDGAEMTLRHIILSGVTGWDRLSSSLQDTWTPDVKANQIADIVSGVSPIRSLVNVGSGVADLILLPIEQYRKDGRISRGVQKGTNSFVKSTAMEMMKLGARLATGTQVVLEKAEGVLGGRVDAVPILEGENGEEVLSRYANQPGNTREGIQAGYTSLTRNINSAAQTILAVPMEVYERSGDDGPLRAVVRAVPIAVLKPMIGASEAVSKTLLGMRNSLDPQGRREQGDKYK